MSYKSPVIQSSLIKPSTVVSTYTIRLAEQLENTYTRKTPIHPYFYKSYEFPKWALQLLTAVGVVIVALLLGLVFFFSYQYHPVKELVEKNNVTVLEKRRVFIGVSDDQTTKAYMRKRSHDPKILDIVIDMRTRLIPISHRDVVVISMSRKIYQDEQKNFLVFNSSYTTETNGNVVLFDSLGLIPSHDLKDMQDETVTIHYTVEATNSIVGNVARFDFQKKFHVDYSNARRFCANSNNFS